MTDIDIDREPENRIDIDPPTPAVRQMTLDEMKAAAPAVARGCYDVLIDTLLAFGHRHSVEHRRPPLMRLVCSRPTFRDYLECPLMISGPWDWTMADSVPHAYLRVMVDGEHVGTLQLHSLALAS